MSRNFKYSIDYNSVTGVVKYKGAINCSDNPNYPAANAGHAYVISISGRVGGASGSVVTAGDMLICNTDGTPAGDEATVGGKWNIIEKNIDLSNITIVGGEINATSIGNTTPASGVFTTLKQTVGAVDKAIPVSDATGAFALTSPADVRGVLNVEDGADVTATHTAAGIAGQGALATKNDVDIDTEVTDGTIYKRFLDTEKSKLSGIEASAVSLATVKADVSIAAAITNTHVQGTDQGLDTGGENAITAAEAKTGYTHSQIITGNPHHVTQSEVGLSNVDNTSDINKPVSISQRAALDSNTRFIYLNMI